MDSLWQYWTSSSWLRLGMITEQTYTLHRYSSWWLWELLRGRGGQWVFVGWGSLNKRTLSIGSPAVFTEKYLSIHLASCPLCKRTSIHVQCMLHCRYNNPPKSLILYSYTGFHCSTEGWKGDVHRKWEMSSGWWSEVVRQEAGPDVIYHQVIAFLTYLNFVLDSY